MATISGSTMELFFADAMPNGKEMIKAYPELEKGSAEWGRLVPISLFTFSVYCGTTLTVVTYVVWKAPRLAAEWPKFTERFRFAFGALRPDAWYWALAQVWFGFMMNF